MCLTHECNEVQLRERVTKTFTVLTMAQIPTFVTILKWLWFGVTISKRSQVKSTEWSDKFRFGHSTAKGSQSPNYTDCPLSGPESEARFFFHVLHALSRCVFNQSESGAGTAFPAPVPISYFVIIIVIMPESSKSVHDFVLVKHQLIQFWVFFKWWEIWFRGRNILHEWSKTTYRKSCPRLSQFVDDTWTACNTRDKVLVCST